MSSMNIYCYRDRRESNATVADKLTSLARSAVEKKGHCSLVLAGGSTPEALYRLLAGSGWQKKIAWSETHIFFGDERCVPPDHQHSNYRMAQQALLQHIPVPEEQIYRIRGEENALDAAGQYEEQVGKYLSAAGGVSSGFDIVLLGIGSDGHTASLFPGDAALHADHLAAPVAPPQHMHPPVARVTLTLKTLSLSNEICFLVHGKEKEPIVTSLLSDSEARYPAARVRGRAVSYFLSGMDCTLFNK